MSASDACTTFPIGRCRTQTISPWGVLALYYQSWKRRWFVLKTDLLAYHKRESKKGVIKGCINLSNVTQIKRTVPARKHRFVFSLKYITDNDVEREVRPQCR